MDTAGTGAVLGTVGLILVSVQGGLIRPLARRLGERRLILAGVAIQSAGFAGSLSRPATACRRSTRA